MSDNIPSERAGWALGISVSAAADGNSKFVTGNDFLHFAYTGVCVFVFSHTNAPLFIGSPKAAVVEEDPSLPSNITTSPRDEFSMDP